MAKVDLNKLKTEIDVRKRERGIVAEQVQGATLMPKDEFLYALQQSLQTGKDTKATNLIKLVENKTAAKHGEVVRHNIDTSVIAPPQQRPAQRPMGDLNEVDMSPERDEQLFADLERKRKQTLAEQISGYINTPPVGAPMSNAPTQMMQPMQLNEAYLTENVKKIVNNYLIENFGPVVEEAIKSTIIEMYAVERIKEVLQENKEMIKSLVYETIREIQAKKKAQ
jgi:hypothetical protein